MKYNINMSTVADMQGKKIIVAFPTEKFGKYLEKVEAISVKDLTFEKMRMLYLLTIADFVSGKLSLDEMSEIASSLWKPPFEADSKEEKELKEALLSASELNFYVRRIPEIKPEGHTFIWFMTDVMNYYEGNKKVLGRHHV